MIVIALIGFGLATVAAVLLTYGVKSYAERSGVFDHPNERSLHVAPTPRGGGLSIVIVTLIAQAVLIIAGILPLITGMTWLTCGLCIALLGWTDDHIGLSARVRLVAQVIVAGAYVLVAVGSRDAAGVAPAAWPLMLTIPLCVFGIVWLVNLYNFMDGSDGLAATEGMLVTLFGGIIALHAGGVAVMIMAAVVAGGCLGFLWWNWQPARIFMGDAGSYFIGFQLAALALYGHGRDTSPLLWAILLAPFITDASLTLLRRLISGESWYRAHRSHAYQLLVRGGWSHARVALALAIFTVVILWPLTWIGHVAPVLVAPLALMTYLLTGMIWLLILLRSRQ